MSLEGRLEDMGLADIFQIISLSKRSGVLTLIRKEGTGRLVFNSGRVVFGSSDTRSRLGYTLVQKGLIRNDDLEYALRIQKGRGSKKPIGTILVEMGSLSSETFDQELKNHIVSVVHDLLQWDTGSFYFELTVPTAEQIASSGGFNTESLLLEAFKVQDEMERDRQLASEKAPPPSEEPVKESTPRIEPALTAPNPADTLKAPGRRRDLELLTSMIAEMSRPSSNSELTLMILRFASELMGRAVVFLVRENEVVGLGQFGLDLGSVDEKQKIRSITIPLSDPSVLAEAVETQRPFKGPLDDRPWHKYLVEQLGSRWPTEVFLAPIVCDGSSIAILYADNLPSDEPIGITEGLETFIKVAEIAFSKALLERKAKG
jgi:hypothetical protein